MGHRWQEVRITLNRAALEGANAVLDRWGGLPIMRWKIRPF